MVPFATRACMPIAVVLGLLPVLRYPPPASLSGKDPGFGSAGSCENSPKTIEK